MKASVKIAPPIFVLKFFIGWLILPFGEQERQPLCRRLYQIRRADLNAITLDYRALHPRLVYEMAGARRFGRFSLAEIPFKLGLRRREAARLMAQRLTKADWFASA